MVHWYGPFWDPGTTTGSWVQTEWCADETAAGTSLPIRLDLGGGNSLSGRVCCCACKNKLGKEKSKHASLLAQQDGCDLAFLHSLQSHLLSTARDGALSL
jgi:hypothetical protein